MSSSLIVEYLDEVEEGHLGLAATEEMLPKLVLDRGEPALDDSVVVAVAPVGSCSRSCHASQGDVGSLCWHTDCPDRSDARAPRPVGDVSVPWCINTGKSLIPLTLRFLAQKRNLLIPLELSRVMHQGSKMTLRLYGALNYSHGLSKGPSFGTGRGRLFSEHRLLPCQHRVRCKPPWRPPATQAREAHGS